MDAAALSSMPQTHPRTDPLSLPPSHFVPTQPQRLTTNGYQSPYFYRTSGLLQIAVSALLHATSVEVREVLDAEHCRYGTRDLSPIVNCSAGFFTKPADGEALLELMNSVVPSLIEARTPY